MLKSANVNRVEDLKSVLISGIEIQNLEYAQIIFDLALVQYFLTVPLSLCLGMTIYILCHSMVEVCELLFDFDIYR